MFLGGYGLYLLFSLPALLLGLWAQFKVKSAFNQYSRVRSFTGLTGAEVARRMLNSNGLNNVQVEEVGGMLSDHYDPTSRTLRLSREVYHSNSLAAAGVAAHESGHAVQHAEGYTALKFRTAMVPSVQIGSWLGPIIFIVGYFFSSEPLSWAGIILFAATAVFALVTLPVELDATRRERLAVAARDAEQVLVTAAVGSDVPELLDGSRFEITAGQIATTAFSSHRTDDV